MSKKKDNLNILFLLLKYHLDYNPLGCNKKTLEMITQVIDKMKKDIESIKE